MCIRDRGVFGGLGLAAVELGKLMGARVIAAASNEEKLATARDHGADESVLYDAAGLDRDGQKALSQKLKDLTDGKGVDVAYDPVGGSYSEPVVRAMGWNGRFLVVGFAAGDIPRIPLNLALLKSCQLVGVFWGLFSTTHVEQSQKNLQQIADWVQDKTLRPFVSETFPLAKAAAALEHMAARKARGKIVILMEGAA